VKSESYSLIIVWTHLPIIHINNWMLQTSTRIFHITVHAM